MWRVQRIKGSGLCERTTGIGGSNFHLISSFVSMVFLFGEMDHARERTEDCRPAAPHHICFAMPSASSTFYHFKKKQARKNMRYIPQPLPQASFASFTTPPRVPLPPYHHQPPPRTPVLTATLKEGGHLDHTPPTIIAIPPSPSPSPSLHSHRHHAHTPPAPPPPPSALADANSVQRPRRARGQAPPNSTTPGRWKWLYHPPRRLRSQS